MHRGRLLFTIIIVLTVAFCSETSFAQDWKKDLDFDLGLELGGFYHTEGDFAAKGVMPGLFASVKGYDPLFFDASARFATGSLIYDGVSWGATPAKASTSDFIAEGRALIGYDVSRTPDAAISLYSGLGFWFWDNRTGPAGYGREYRSLYFPVGFDYAYSNRNSGAKYGLRVEYDLPLHTKVKSMAEETDPALGDVKNMIHDSHGSRVSLYAEAPVGADMRVSFEPYLRYWSFAGSDASDAGGGTMMSERASENYEFGLAISLIF